MINPEESWSLNNWKINQSSRVYKGSMFVAKDFRSFCMDAVLNG